MKHFFDESPLPRRFVFNEHQAEMICDHFDAMPSCIVLMQQLASELFHSGCQLDWASHVRCERHVERMACLRQSNFT